MVSLQNLIRQQTPRVLNKTVTIDTRNKRIHFLAPNRVQGVGNYPVSNGPYYVHTVLEVSDVSEPVIINSDWTVVIDLPKIIPKSLQNVNRFPTNFSVLLTYSQPSLGSTITLINNGRIEMNNTFDPNNVIKSRQSVGGDINVLGGLAIGNPSQDNLILGQVNNNGTIDLKQEIKNNTNTGFNENGDIKSIIAIVTIGVPISGSPFLSKITNSGQIYLSGPKTKLKSDHNGLLTNVKETGFIFVSFVSNDFLNTSKGVITVLPNFKLEKCRCNFNISPSLVSISSYDTQDGSTPTWKFENEGIIRNYAQLRFGAGTTDQSDLEKSQIYDNWNALIYIDNVGSEIILTPNASSSAFGLVKRYQCFYLKSQVFKEMLQLSRFAHRKALFN